jgi:antitoxin (DNA-binding transcriptional repressor) of toxin-antitoxin stability system
MTVIDRKKATESLVAYVNKIEGGPFVVTDAGKPVAVLVPIENADLETVSLSTERKFIDLIERSRARVRKEGAISSKEMRRRFEKVKK